MTEDTAGKSPWKWWGKDTTSLPWAKGWQETGPASRLSASHAPISTYRSAVAQSFPSLPYQLALPSSSSSRRGGLKGLHVRNKKGGGILKRAVKLYLIQEPHFREQTLHSWQLLNFWKSAPVSLPAILLRLWNAQGLKWPKNVITHHHRSELVFFIHI